jgi:hypothetical protein
MEGHNNKSPWLLNLRSSLAICSHVDADIDPARTGPQLGFTMFIRPQRLGLWRPVFPLPGSKMEQLRAYATETSLLNEAPYWRRVPQWEGVVREDFISYRWQVSLSRNSSPAALAAVLTVHSARQHGKQQDQA